MKKYNTLITIGFITALVPLLGIPSSWKYFFTIVLGLSVAITAILLRREGSASRKGERREAPSYARTYIENSEEASI